MMASSLTKMLLVVLAATTILSSAKPRKMRRSPKNLGSSKNGTSVLAARKKTSRAAREATGGRNLMTMGEYRNRRMAQRVQKSLEAATFDEALKGKAKEADAAVTSEPVAVEYTEVTVDTGATSKDSYCIDLSIGIAGSVVELQFSGDISLEITTPTDPNNPLSTATIAGRIGAALKVGKLFLTASLSVQGAISMTVSLDPAQVKNKWDWVYFGLKQWGQDHVDPNVIKQIGSKKFADDIIKYKERTALFTDSSMEEQQLYDQYRLMYRNFVYHLMMQSFWGPKHVAAAIKALLIDEFGSDIVDPLYDQSGQHPKAALFSYIKLHGTDELMAKMDKAYVDGVEKAFNRGFQGSLANADLDPKGFSCKDINLESHFTADGGHAPTPNGLVYHKTMMGRHKVDNEIVPKRVSEDLPHAQQAARRLCVFLKSGLLLPGKDTALNPGPETVRQNVSDTWWNHVMNGREANQESNKRGMLKIMFPTLFHETGMVLEDGKDAADKGDLAMWYLGEYRVVQGSMDPRLKMLNDAIRSIEDGGTSTLPFFTWAGLLAQKPDDLIKAIAANPPAQNADPCAATTPYVQDDCACGLLALELVGTVGIGFGGAPSMCDNEQPISVDVAKKMWKRRVNINAGNADSAIICRLGSKWAYKPVTTAVNINVLALEGKFEFEPETLKENGMKTPFALEMALKFPAPPGLASFANIAMLDDRASVDAVNLFKAAIKGAVCSIVGAFDTDSSAADQDQDESTKSMSLGLRTKSIQFLKSLATGATKKGAMATLVAAMDGGSAADIFGSALNSLTGSGYETVIGAQLNVERADPDGNVEFSVYLVKEKSLTVSLKPIPTPVGEFGGSLFITNEQQVRIFGPATFGWPSCE